jgi:hypothetical protein
VSKDLASILADWQHEPDTIQVRIILGDDGREKIQMRVDLGVLQMELDGRPDGLRPQGAESLLEFHERRADGAAAPYELDPEDCAELMREGIQYYHRYLALFHLQRFDLVARDTARNLRLFSFVSRHARREQDRLQCEQYRPYVTMMNSRARAQQALDQGDYTLALRRIDEGIAAILACLADPDEADAASCPELAFLRRWRAEVDRARPMGPIERLQDQLDLAVAREQYEEAARLRDQIRRLQTACDPAHHRPISSDSP